MPTAVSPRRRENQNANLDLNEEESLAQLRQAVRQNVQDRADASKTNGSDDSNNDNNKNDNGNNDGAAKNRAPVPASCTDGARKPIIAGADYASLRLLTRRQPKDPEHVLQGLDTSNMDLSWTAREGSNSLDPSGQPWRYPKKRGKGEGSNLDQFKDEITERTKNGEGCKAIAEAFIAMGVDTSVRAVARQRMKWGLRQRAKRKMTEQGIANIRKAHLEQAKRMANSDPVPVKRVRIRVMRKAEITRMTKQGMSAAQIAENLTARGVELARGAATVERLRTVWGLTEDTQRSVNNIRATARNQALKAQQTQFINIAKELGIEDIDAWVKSKMDEEVAQDARREYAYKLMGDARPKPINPDQLRRNAAHLRSLKALKKAEGNLLNKMPGVDLVPQVVSPAFSLTDNGAMSTSADGSPPVTPGSNAPPEMIELSDNEDDIGDEDLDDGAGEALEAIETCEGHQAAATAAPPLQAPIETLPQMPTSMDVESPMAMQSQTAQATTGVFLLGTQPETVPPPVTNVTADLGFKNTVIFKPYEYGGAHNQANVTTAPPAGMPGRRPMSFANIAPRPIHAPRAIAPRPISPQMPPVHPQKPEIDYMAQFGMSPYPCHGKPPQKYLTPNGLITTDGYEYLGSPPPPPGCEPPAHQPRPDIIRLPLPPAANYIVVPRPPPPKVSLVPQPPLVIPPEEAQKHGMDAKLLQKYHQASQECLDMVLARASGMPIKDSLTGLPPSLQDVQFAKEKLKEAAAALLVEL